MTCGRCAPIPFRMPDFRREFSIVAAHASLKQAQADLARGIADLVVVDGSSRIDAELEGIAQLVADGVRVRIALLVQDVTRQQLARAFREGVQACLLARSTASELAASLRHAARGEIVTSPELGGLFSAVLQAALKSRCAALDRLTPRQQRIALLSSYGRSNKEIADDYGLSHYTIKGELAIIRSTLHVRSRAELAVLIHR